ncbi:MAG: ISAs1 family transposase [Beijerinckiaceae bacterium]
MNGVVIIDSLRDINDKIERETGFYITSLTLPANRLGPIVRSDWSVENSLHWVMDVVFRDDECRIRTDQATANFTTVKHIALNPIGIAPGKDSLRLKRKVAAWDDEFLANLIAA